eukprot:3290846-Pyramimonas_sp.AAC.1
MRPARTCATHSCRPCPPAGTYTSVDLSYPPTKTAPRRSRRSRRLELRPRRRRCSIAVIASSRPQRLLSGGGCKLIEAVQRINTVEFSRRSMTC